MNGRKIVGIYDLPDEDALEFLHNVQESLHQGLDGWSESEQSVITAYLDDLALAVAVCKEDKEVLRNAQS